MSASMKIKTVECLAFGIPNNPYLGGLSSSVGVSTGGRYLQHSYYRAVYSPNTEGFLVRITTESGLEGYGEAQACILPDAVAVVVKELLAPFLIGKDASSPKALRDLLYGLMRERGHNSGLIPDAVAACDMALWDLASRAAEMPLYQFLGGTFRDALPCYVSGVPAQTIAEELDAVERWCEKGFHRFKFSYQPGVDNHVQHVAALRERFGDSIQIMIDAHWAYQRKDAIRLGKALDAFDVHWIECPLIPESPQLQASLADAFQAFHAGGEEYRTVYDFLERLRVRALDLAQPDVGRAGITECMRIAAVCYAHDVPIAYHLGVGLGVYTAATLHVAAATPLLDLVEYQPTQVAVAGKYFHPAIAPERGSFNLPPGPGIGVIPDWAALKELALPST